jgi:hypothetical protein
MDFHGITMYGDLNTDNLKAKDANGIRCYDDSDMITFRILDGGYIQAYQGTSINEFSIDDELSGNSDDALVTEKAINQHVINNYQPLDSNLTTIAAFTASNNHFMVGDGNDWVLEEGLTARTSLGLGTASTKDYEDTLDDTGIDLPTSIAIKTYGDDRWLNEADNLSDLPNASTSRTNLGVAIGSDVQAWHDTLDDISVLSFADSNFIVGNGSSFTVEAGPVARESLGLTGNSNTTHYHDSRYFTEAEMVDGSTVTAHINRIKLSGTTKADGYFYAGTNTPTNVTRLNYDGYLWATRMYNAVYADFADFQDLNDELVYGKCYYDTYDGAKICNSYCQKGVIGIASDTYGQACGSDSTKEAQVPISVGGWVLAYVDKEYEIGTPLTNDSKGNLTEIEIDEKLEYPERILATYKKKERDVMWNNLVVDNRHWVKIK